MKHKKLICLLLSLIFCFAMVPMTAMAAEAPEASGRIMQRTASNPAPAPRQTLMSLPLPSSWQSWRPT